MVDETLFDYLHMAIVDFYNDENEKNVEISATYLSQIGLFHFSNRLFYLDSIDFFQVIALVIHLANVYQKKMLVIEMN